MTRPVEIVIPTIDSAILSSTFLLTLLMLIGLTFFIRASVKDRTEKIQLTSEQTQVAFRTQLQEHFSQRAYRIQEDAAGQAEQGIDEEIVLQGFVRPSLFLAVFLTFLAAIGGFCLSLVLAVLFPALQAAFLSLVLLAPLAGIFYWKQAGRIETVRLKVEPAADKLPSGEIKSVATIAAHRDEIIQLRQALAAIKASASV